MGSCGRIWYRYIMYINKEDRRSRAIGKVLLYITLLRLLRTVHNFTVNDGNSRTYGSGNDSGAYDGSRIDASILAPVGNDIYRN